LRQDTRAFGSRVPTGVHASWSLDVTREVLVRDESVTIEDFLVTPRERTWTMTVPLTTKPSQTFLELEDAESGTGCERPFAGSNSSTYGAGGPSPWSGIRTPARAVLWGVGEQPDVTRTEAKTGVGGFGLSAACAEVGVSFFR
jgi:hypothetical protein